RQHDTLDLPVALVPLDIRVFAALPLLFLINQGITFFQQFKLYLGHFAAQQTRSLAQLGCLGITPKHTCLRGRNHGQAQAQNGNSHENLEQGETTRRFRVAESLAHSTSLSPKSTSLPGSSYST